MFSLLKAQVQPLVQELRSLKPCRAANNNNKPQKIKNQVKPAFTGRKIC